MKVTKKEEMMNNMKKGWEIKKLGEVCELINRGISPKYIEYSGMIVLNQKCIRDHEINFEPSRFHDEVLKRVSDEKIIKKGDVLINSTGTGTLGRVAQVREELENVTVDSHVTIVRPLKEIFYPDFFGWVLILIEDEIAKRGEGCGGQTELARSTLKNDFHISYPKSIAEQQRIVAILDEAFAAIAKAKANAQQNLKNAKELFESYLQGVFNADDSNKNGWEENCLDELGVITSSKRIYKSEYVKEGVPFYRTKEIKELSNGKDISLELFISRARYEDIKNSFGVPLIGDLLMSAVGTIGEIMVIENEDEFYFKDGNIVWFKSFENLDTNYLKYALTAFVEKIKSLAIGAAYSALTIEKLNKYRIAYPKSKKTQQTIVQKLDALNTETKKLEAVYKQKLNDLEELKKSVLQKAFSGKLKTTKKIGV